VDPAERAELLERAGAEASLAGRHDAAERHLRSAMVLRRELGDRPAIARGIAALGTALNTAWRTGEAIALLEPAAAEFADLADDASGIMLGSQLARGLFLNAEHRRAIEVADRVLAAAERADIRPVIVDTLVTKGSALGFAGRSVEGLALLAGGQAIAAAEGFSVIQLRALGNRSAVDSSRDPRAAVSEAREGLALARRVGHRSMATILASNGAESALRTGDWAWATATMEAVLADDLEMSDRAAAIATVIQFAAARGEPTGELIAELNRLVGGSTDPQNAMNVPAAAGFVAFADGDLAKARAAWNELRGFVPESTPIAAARAARAALWLGDADGAAADLSAMMAFGAHGSAIEADRTTIRAGLAALAGQAGDALLLYRDALRAWRDLGCRWDEALAGLDMAILLDPTHPDVAAAAARSREILGGLGAVPMLERLDEAMTRAGAVPEARTPA
jgi:tetratricopeptide (TPR) repeat protein